MRIAQKEKLKASFVKQDDALWLLSLCRLQIRQLRTRNDHVKYHILYGKLFDTVPFKTYERTALALLRASPVNLLQMS